MKKKALMFAAMLAMTSSVEAGAYCTGLTCSSYDFISSSDEYNLLGGYSNLFRDNVRLPKAFLSNMAIADREIPINYTEKAESYLNANQTMREQILKIATKMREYFSYGIILVDTDESNSCVVIYIVDNQSVDKMLDDLNAFDYEWWIDAKERFSDNIIVDVMPV